MYTLYATIYRQENDFQGQTWVTKNKLINNLSIALLYHFMTITIIAKIIVPGSRSFYTSFGTNWKAILSVGVSSVFCCLLVKRSLQWTEEEIRKVTTVDDLPVVPQPLPRLNSPK